MVIKLVQVWHIEGNVTQPRNLRLAIIGVSLGGGINVLEQLNPNGRMGAFHKDAVRLDIPLAGNVINPLALQDRLESLLQLKHIPVEFHGAIHVCHDNVYMIRNRETHLTSLSSGVATLISRARRDERRSAPRAV